MRIFILGAGHMGEWLIKELSPEHEVCFYDPDRKSPGEEAHDSLRIINPGEAKAFGPELMINAASLSHTIEAFEQFVPYLSEECMVSDVASVKAGLSKYYRALGKRFVSTHPMFGPTFAKTGDLGNENAIIIKESDREGKAFFRAFYQERGIRVHEYTFEDHDRTTAYSLSLPFASTMVFAACMKDQDAPGTTFRRHMEVAKGLLSEDDSLLTEIMFNPYTIKHIEEIGSRLAYLIHMIRGKDYEEMEKFLNRLRENIGLDAFGSGS